MPFCLSKLFFGCRGRCSTPSRVHRTQFKLNVVRVAEREHVESRACSEVFDLPVRHSSRVEDAHCLVKIGTATDTQADVIKAHAVLVEPIAAGRMRRVRSRTNGKTHA